ncbi:hypothetical protein AXF42_Ash000600 [Apostasia shenzhenica]|uniref:FAD-dependent oxidoreductase domain-containing protein 1 n=1 Tax=Apostasia shenzhenica TaxID=1088818 RepID=A0A2I0AGX2_9ASPA|nr:hypothetical protein AXF42_Ash000600 [Apostasia shenzhenica]
MESLSLPANLRISLKTLTSSPKSPIPFLLPRVGARNHAVPFLRAQATAALLRRSEHDVIVVGAGIIGLSIARQLLLGSDLSVAVVDAGVPCSGATGAGQGYIWMAHKTPSSETWELALRSKQLWEELVESLKRRGLDPLRVLGWKKTVLLRVWAWLLLLSDVVYMILEWGMALNRLWGRWSGDKHDFERSLLIGRTMKELAILKERVELLSLAGLPAEFLSSSSLIYREPELYVGKEGAAAFFPDDCQLDAFQTVCFIEKVACKKFQIFV